MELKILVTICQCVFCDSLLQDDVDISLLKAIICLSTVSLDEMTGIHFYCYKKKYSVSSVRVRIYQLQEFVWISWLEVLCLWRKWQSSTPPLSHLSYFVRNMNKISPVRSFITEWKRLDYFLVYLQNLVPLIWHSFQLSRLLLTLTDTFQKQRFICLHSREHELGLKSNEPMHFSKSTSLGT